MSYIRDEEGGKVQAGRKGFGSSRECLHTQD